MSIDAVRRSIAIDRLGPLPATHVGDRLVGPAVVVVDDEIPGSATEVLGRFDAWLVGGHHLRREFMRDSDGEWSKRSDLVGVVIRAVRSATGEGRLGDVQRLTVTVRDTGMGTCAVRVMVDRVIDRRMWGSAGSAVAVGGTATVVVAVDHCRVAVDPPGDADRGRSRGHGRSTRSPKVEAHDPRDREAARLGARSGRPDSPRHRRRPTRRRPTQALTLPQQVYPKIGQITVHG